MVPALAVALQQVVSKFEGVPAENGPKKHHSEGENVALHSEVWPVGKNFRRTGGSGEPRTIVFVTDSWMVGLTKVDKFDEKFLADADVINRQVEVNDPMVGQGA